MPNTRRKLVTVSRKPARPMQPVAKAPTLEHELPPVKHKHPPQPVPPIAEPEVVEEKAKHHWYPPSSHPAIGTVVEIEASGDIVTGRHHEGLWVDEEGNTLNISRWRHK
jgi:hypothetical protein